MLRLPALLSTGWRRGWATFFIFAASFPTHYLVPLLLSCTEHGSSQVLDLINNTTAPQFIFLQNLSFHLYRTVFQQYISQKQ
jgi:hypothetical protein